MLQQVEEFLLCEDAIIVGVYPSEELRKDSQVLLVLSQLEIHKRAQEIAEVDLPSTLRLVQLLHLLLSGWSLSSFRA